MENQKRINTNAKKCQNCGSNLTYYPQKKCLICKNCQSTTPINLDENIMCHDFNTTKILDNQIEIKKWQNENKIMKCENCGATVILDKLEISSKCPYCGNPMVLVDSEFPGLKPDAILPFAFDGTEASEKFGINIRKKWFLPNQFKKSLPSSDMVGTYVPCFSFDANTHSVYKGIFSYEESYRNSDGKSETRTVRKSVSGTLDKNFINIIVESSSQLTQEDLNSIKPYNLNDAYKYDQDFIRGSTIEYYDNSIENCSNIADMEISALIEKILLRKHNCTRVESLDIDTQKLSYNYKYFLLPIYVFQYKYKEKFYKTIMNGQNGNVGSNVPRSTVKITFFILAIILIFFGIFGLVFLISGGSILTNSFSMEDIFELVN